MLSWIDLVLILFEITACVFLKYLVLSVPELHLVTVTQLFIKYGPLFILESMINYYLTSILGELS